MVTVLGGAFEIREELDVWMDSRLHSQSICRWLSARTVGNDLCALRDMKVFTLVSGA